MMNISLYILSCIIIVILAHRASAGECQDGRGAVFGSFSCLWVSNKSERCDIFDPKTRQKLRYLCKVSCDVCPRRSISKGYRCKYHFQCKSGFCSRGICTWRENNGVPCTVNQGCQSWNCSNFICKGMNGQTCLQHSHCDSKYCSNGVCLESNVDISKSKLGERCIDNNSCENGNCINYLCSIPITHSGNNVGEMCRNNIDCVSKNCSHGTCMASQSCDVLGGFDGPFRDETIVLVFVGSGFSDLDHWDVIAKEYYNGLNKVEMFSDNKAKFKALYVRELSRDFCDYNCNGVDRLLCCDQSIAMSITNKCFPKRSTMQTIIIHNDDKYGGAGYSKENIAVVSTNYSGKYLLLHELGHSVFNFGDEYYSSPDTADTSANCDVAGCPKVITSRFLNEAI